MKRNKFILLFHPVCNTRHRNGIIQKIGVSGQEYKMKLSKEMGVEVEKGGSNIT